VNDATNPIPPADAGRPAVPHPKTIKSFVLRAGRTTTGQTKAFETLGPQFLLPYRAAPLDLDAAFVLPEKDFLCCEVHQPGVGALLKRIGEQSIPNIRIVSHDAVDVIDHMLPLASLDGIHVFFPDPWHKKKHNKRRLLQSPLVAKLAARLKPGGYLHCATDWQNYAEQMLEVLGAEPLLRNTAADYAPKPEYRPLTKFENRGIKLGHGVWDLVFQRV